MPRHPGTTRRHAPAARPPPPLLDLDAVWATAAVSPIHRTIIHRRYGVRTTTVLRTQPYRLVQDIPGLSFQTADTIAPTFGASKTSPARLQAGLLAVLHQAMRQGHTGLLLPTALCRATRLLGVPYPVVEEYCLRSVLAGGRALVVEQHGPDTFLTSRALRQVEEHVADLLAEHVSIPLLPLLPHAEAVAAQIAAASGLNAEQTAAAGTAAQRPLPRLRCAPAPPACHRPQTVPSPPSATAPGGLPAFVPAGVGE